MGCLLSFVITDIFKHMVTSVIKVHGIFHKAQIASKLCLTQMFKAILIVILFKVILLSKETELIKNFYYTLYHPTSFIIRNAEVVFFS